MPKEPQFREGETVIYDGEVWTVDHIGKLLIRLYRVDFGFKLHIKVPRSKEHLITHPHNHG